MYRYVLTISLILGLLLPGATTILAEEDNPKELDTGFGFSAGSICGNGFSIKKMPMKGVGYQAGIIYLQTKDDSYFNFGCEMLYTLHRASSTALYLIFGVSYEAHSYIEEHWNLDHYEQERVHDNGVAGGFGMGISYNYARWERLWWSGELVLRAYKEEVLPMPQFGVHYLFK